MTQPLPMKNEFDANFYIFHKITKHKIDLQKNKNKTPTKLFGVIY